MNFYHRFFYNYHKKRANFLNHNRHYHRMIYHRDYEVVSEGY